jgi:hypothetical protein
MPRTFEPNALEWRDSTGLSHPSLVVLDVTNDPLPDSEKYTSLPVLKTKRIYAKMDFFHHGGRLNRRKLPKIAGYRFVTYNAFNDFALYFLYEKTP